jgi:hypothetical protein
MSDTEHVAELYNTIYQAQTDAPQTNNLREIIWVATNTDPVTPFEAASNIATTTTRTTIFAQTNTISLAATTRPAASLYQATLTNESVGQTILGSATVLSQKDNTQANYNFFPPETSAESVTIFATTGTVYEFTNSPSNTVLIEYSQSQLATQWFTSAASYLANFPDAPHNIIQTVWTSREVTASTQNKYVTDGLISNITTTSESDETINGASTTETSVTRSFGVEGNSLSQSSLATLGTSQGHSAIMSFFRPVGAALEDQSGHAASINLPISSVAGEYTALDAPAVTTVFPKSWTFVNDEDETYSVSLYGKSASYSRAGGTTSTSQSGLFQTVGETAYESVVYPHRIGGNTNSCVLQIAPGAYRVIDGSQTTTVSTIGGVTNSTRAINTTWYRPVSFVVPSTQDSISVLWTASRNVTNTFSGQAL